MRRCLWTLYRRRCCLRRLRQSVAFLFHVRRELAKTCWRIKPTFIPLIFPVGESIRSWRVALQKNGKAAVSDGRCNTTEPSALDVRSDGARCRHRSKRQNALSPSLLAFAICDGTSTSCFFAMHFQTPLGGSSQRATSGVPPFVSSTSAPSPGRASALRDLCCVVRSPLFEGGAPRAQLIGDASVDSHWRRCVTGKNSRSCPRTPTTSSCESETAKTKNNWKNGTCTCSKKESDHRRGEMLPVPRES